jgi:hypothetical protein
MGSQIAIITCREKCRNALAEGKGWEKARHDDNSDKEVTSIWHCSSNSIKSAGINDVHVTGRPSAG